MFPIRGEAADALDKAMDVLLVPGFSRIGYSVRRRMFGWRMPDLNGRHVMVTGANSGLGLAASIEMARCGAKVHMVCRSAEKGERARAEVNVEAGVAGSDREPELHLCDLSSVADVRRFAGEFLDSGEPLDVLINNAGVMPPERERTDEGLELTFATNVVGPYLLTELLIPRLAEGRDPRVVTMSSGGMYSSGFKLDDPQLEGRDYKPTAFYAHTKRAEVMLAEAWQERSDTGITFCSMHPGWAATPGVSSSLPGFDRLLGPILRDSFEGSDTAVWLAGTGAEEAPGGLFFHDRRSRPKSRKGGPGNTPEQSHSLLGVLSTLVAEI